MFKIKNYGTYSEVLQDGKLVFIGSEMECQKYCYDNQVVKEIENLPVTTKMLRDVFESLQDTDNWKNPISKTIKSNLSLFEIELIKAAIEFFHADVPKIQCFISSSNSVGYGYTITSKGYRG